MWNCMHKPVQKRARRSHAPQCLLELPLACQHLPPMPGLQLLRQACQQLLLLLACLVLLGASGCDPALAPARHRPQL